jgi:hypothetical protein
MMDVRGRAIEHQVPRRQRLSGGQSWTGPKLRLGRTGKRDSAGGVGGGGEPGTVEPSLARPIYWRRVLIPGVRYSSALVWAWGSVTR